jgi:uncharacterized protein
VPRSPYRGPIIDVHTHPMLGPTPIFGDRPHAARDYLRAARGLRIRAAGALTIAVAGRPAETRQKNDAILDLAAGSGGRFFAVPSVHPADGAAALAELDRVARRGAKALKLHPNSQGFDVADPAVRAVVARATRSGLPVLFDAYSPFDPAQPGKFLRLAMEEPAARLILAHALGPQFPELLVHDVLVRYPFWKRNIWVDLSATTSLLAGSPFAEQYLWSLRRVGADRLLFGSDYPFDPPVRAVDAVRRLGFTRPELDRVLYRNARELFGLGP